MFEWQKRALAGLEKSRIQRVRTELGKASREWSLPALVRNYPSGRKGEEAFADEVGILADHGYQPAMQSAEGSHLHAGRLLLTGGLSILAGRRGIRSKGKLTVTFTKA